MELAKIIHYCFHPVNCVVQYAEKVITHVGNDTVEFVSCVVRNMAGG